MFGGTTGNKEGGDYLYEGEVNSKYSKNTQYTMYNNYYPGGKEVGAIESDESDDELYKRKKAQAELEREEAELKRNIKSLMRMTPESRVLEDPVMADRVRNARYEP